MDGFYEHLSNINLREVIKRLQYEQYDTDALLEDIPIAKDPDPSQCNVASLAVASNKFESIAHFVYLTKCMFLCD